jgi:soluble P-type ATPase
MLRFMPIEVPIPGGVDLHLRHLLLDVNGTLTNRGTLVDGVQERIQRLRSRLEVHLLSADTFGTVDDVAMQLGGLPVDTIATGEDKAAFARRIGPAGCAAIGNGANDELMLETVVLGIAVLGREGASARALNAADLVTPTVLDALDLLTDPSALAATLRS